MDQSNYELFNDFESLSELIQQIKHKEKYYEW